MTSTEQPTPLAFSPNDGARMVGLGRTTFYDLLATGRIPSIKVGRRRLVTLAALEQFLASGEAA